MKKEDVWIAVFGVVFIIALIMFVNQQVSMTGYATSATTTSNVTISTYFSIAMSENLSDGIQFGNITSLPTTNENATHNHDGANTTPNGTGTSMWMNVSTDSNSNVDFCIYADVLNTSGGDEIEVGNESYLNNTNTNRTLPDFNSEVSLTESYVQAGYNITTGAENYYRFWLDVPAGTPTGTYNNTVYFKGVSTGGSC